jgi:hypothetical protein
MTRASPPSNSDAIQNAIASGRNDQRPAPGKTQAMQGEYERENEQDQSDILHGHLLRCGS